jgi:hypothetical protein
MRFSFPIATSNGVSFSRSRLTVAFLVPDDVSDVVFIYYICLDFVQQRPRILLKVFI